MRQKERRTEAYSLPDDGRRTNKENSFPQKEDSFPQAEKSFSLRPAEDEDEAFLFDLYASTREEEIAASGLDCAQKEMLLKLQ
ncbi:MAG: hypothetical protein L0229_28185, partial [Blastocatellia bacterium]|nr:hypothetical protein [Blastocatellia bacterium]